MRRALSTSLLILTLLVQGWSNTLAAAPSLESTTQTDAVAVMPCHGADDGDATSSAMPCCEANGSCACAAQCLSAAHALLHAPIALNTASAFHLELAILARAAPPPDPQRLYRPPSSQS